MIAIKYSLPLKFSPAQEWRNPILGHWQHIQQLLLHMYQQQEEAESEA